MKRFLIAVMLVLTVSCLMSFDNRTDMAPSSTVTVTVLADGSHKVDWVLNGDGRTVRSYNILYKFKKSEDWKILSAQIRLTNTAQFPLIPLSGTVTWNPWLSTKSKSIIYDSNVCVFSSATDPTQSDCVWADAQTIPK